MTCTATDTLLAILYTLKTDVLVDVIERCLSGEIDLDDLELWANVIESREDVDCAEYFAGCMAAAWIKASHNFASYPVACFIPSAFWHVPRFFKTLECLLLATIG